MPDAARTIAAEVLDRLGGGPGGLGPLRMWGAS